MGMGGGNFTQPMGSPNVGLPTQAQTYTPIGGSMTQQLPGGVELQGRAGNNPYGSPTGGKGGGTPIPQSVVNMGSPAVGQRQMTPELRNMIEVMTDPRRTGRAFPRQPVQVQPTQQRLMQVYQDMLRGQSMAQNPNIAPTTPQTALAPVGLASLLGGGML